MPNTWKCWLEQTVWNGKTQEKCIGWQESVRELFSGIGIGKKWVRVPKSGDP